MRELKNYHLSSKLTLLWTILGKKRDKMVQVNSRKRVEKDEKIEWMILCLDRDEHQPTYRTGVPPEDQLQSCGWHVWNSSCQLCFFGHCVCLNIWLRGLCLLYSAYICSKYSDCGGGDTSHNHPGWFTSRPVSLLKLVVSDSCLRVSDGMLFQWFGSWYENALLPMSKRISGTIISSDAVPLVVLTALSACFIKIYEGLRCCYIYFCDIQQRDGNFVCL